MISKAAAKYLRISPRKTRCVISLIKNKSVDEAIGILNTQNKRAARLLGKLLNSAIANAKRLPNIQQEDLYISDIYADKGPQIKRMRAEALGRASVLRKPTSHITIELDAKLSRTVKDTGKKDKPKPSKTKKVKKPAVKEKKTTEKAKSKKQAKPKKSNNKE